MTRDLTASLLLFVSICLNLMAMGIGFRDRDRRERSSGVRPLRVRYNRAATVLTAVSVTVLLASFVLRFV